jgi:hypothetical protein
MHLEEKVISQLDGQNLNNLNKFKKVLYLFYLEQYKNESQITFGDAPTVQTQTQKQQQPKQQNNVSK